MKLNIVVKNKNKELLPCKIVVRRICGDDSAGMRSCVEATVETVYCGGSFERIYENGIYDIEIYRGKLHKPFKKRIYLRGEDIIIETVLEKLLDTESMSLYSFDAHSHVSRDEQLATGDLLSASVIMKGEGFNVFFAGSPYDHKTHLEYLNREEPKAESYRRRFSAELESARGENFILDIGNEIVKCRYGHAFLINYTQYPPFSKYYDHEFDPWLFTKIGKEPEYKIAYMHEALLKEKKADSVAVSAHPTSWWWHDNGEFITNIAATLGFEILAGSIDAMVVMGYQSDHKYYQELWFDALNNGYFLPGVAETDTAFDAIPGGHLNFKTYTYSDGFNIRDIAKAVKEGRNIVSSGPVATLTVNGELPGAVLRRTKNNDFQSISFISDESNPRGFTVKIEAFSCYQANLSAVQIIINGKIYKEYNINQNHFTAEERVRFDGDSFIIVKCRDFAGNIAMTNPVYVRDAPFVNKDYLSDVSAAVYKDGEPVSGKYRIDGGPEISFDKKINVKIKPSARLDIFVGGAAKTLRLFELPELQVIFKNLYMGRFNREKKYKPGEVPAELFQLRRIREILDAVETAVHI